MKQERKLVDFEFYLNLYPFTPLNWLLSKISHNYKCSPAQNTINRSFYNVSVRFRMENKKPHLKWIDALVLFAILLGLVWSIVSLIQLDGFYFNSIIFYALLAFIVIVIGWISSKFVKNLVQTIQPILKGLLLLFLAVVVVWVITAPDIDRELRMGTYKINTQYSDFGTYNSSLYNNLTLELTYNTYKFTPCPPFLSDCEGEWKIWNPEGNGNVVLEMNGKWEGLTCYEQCSFDQPPPPRSRQLPLKTLVFTKIKGGD